MRVVVPFPDGRKASLTQASEPATDSVASTRGLILDIDAFFAEHAAAPPIDPPGSALGIDFSGIRFKLKSEPGNDKFEFTRDRHRERTLSSTSDLDEIIALACGQLTIRRREISKASVYKYVSERLEADDQEWTGLLESPDAKDWLKKLAIKRRAQTR